MLRKWENKLIRYLSPVVEGKSPRRGIYIILIIGGVSIFVLPLAFSSLSYFNIIDYSKRGAVGDTINGVAGPFIAIAAALLTFFAFYAQYTANKIQILLFHEQKKQFQTQLKAQKESEAKQEVENKFYKLLELHKQNLNETTISGYEKEINARKAFVSMYKEFRYCYVIVKQKYDDLRTNGTAIKYSDEDLIKLAYIFFYSGVGVHSDILTHAMVGADFEDEFVSAIRKELRFIYDNYHDRAYRLGLNPLNHVDVGEAQLSKGYRPFGGHMSHLGHYYRHLFQTVKFIVEQPENLVPEKTKKEYLRTLRAQLGDHEQVLLYYNALARFGEDWIKNNYFTDYRMIHNIPLPLARFGVSPEEKFKDYIKEHGNIFEWYD